MPVSPDHYAILGDWGTSRLRLHKVVAGRSIDTAHGLGIGALVTSPDESLNTAIQHWRGTALPDYIALCGMVGSSMGLADISHLPCPIDCGDWLKAAHRTVLQGVPLFIAPGLLCYRDGVADVMRGEETQIFGAMALHPELAHDERRFILPGTHSKSVQVVDGRITGFTTHITGELFALLNQYSTLVRCPPDHAEMIADERAGFAAGVMRAQDSGALTSLLFEARTAQLRADKSAIWARHFVSGLLIGHELINLADDAPILIGDPALTSRYALALDMLGLRCGTILNGDDCSFAGLKIIGNVHDNR
jgi:2-dehydro-3-deoxygalactonokinase